MKRLKRILAMALCACLILSVMPSAFADGEDGELGGFEEYEEFYDDPGAIEEYYEGQGTIYDLGNEDDTPAQPVAEEKEPVLEPSDKDEDIFANLSFDAENAAQLNGAEYVLDEIIIKFKPPSDPSIAGKEKQLQHEIQKVEKVGFVEGLGVYVVKVDGLSNNANAVLNRFKNNKYIEYVEPNYTLQTDSIEPLSESAYMKYMSFTAQMINSPAGWNTFAPSGGNSDVIIAVVDSGVALNSSLPPLLNGYSAVAVLSPNNDKNSHGTCVAGVIGAIGGRGNGVAGINWNAAIMPVKVDDATGAITVANVAKGIIWAVDNGARVINLSLGTTSDSITMKNAIDYAYNKGCTLFAATGNTGLSTLQFPAAYSNVMAVGSTNDSATRAATSTYGSGMDVVASGAYYTITAFGTTANIGGTSIASPQAAGLASFIWAINPNLTNAQVYSLIRNGAKTLGGGYNNQTGYGLIDIGKSLELALATTGGTPSVPAPQQPEIPKETPQDVRTPPVITLTGFAEMILEYNQAYIEMGYKAVDCKGIDITSSVKITNTVNSQKAGLYTITYEVTDSAGLSARATRTVTVNAKPAAPPKPTAPKITIIGSNPIILHSTSSTPYKEQSAKAVDHDGTDISSLVKISGVVNRTVPGTYTITYSITSPKSGLASTTTRNVRIVSPTEKRDPRAKYGLSGQAKAGGKITHTGIVSNALGFIDLNVSSIDKNMTISVQLVDTATKKAALTDKFSAAGTKQYKIDQGKYELVVTVDQANGNSKYTINLTMPETAVTLIFDQAEVPLVGLPQIAPIGSNPIILHIGGTPYREQGARAADYLGNDISSSVIITGAPDTSKAGKYTITYTVTGAVGIPASATREVWVLDPKDKNTILLPEVPLIEAPDLVSSPPATIAYTVVKGDSLWIIAQKTYGKGTRWYEIYDMNKDIIGANPSYLKVGTILTIKSP